MLRQAPNLQHLRGGGGVRLPRQHVVADSQCTPAVFVVRVVLRGDDHHIGQLANREEGFRAGEAAELRVARSEANSLHALGYGIRAGHDLEPVWTARGQLSVCLGTGAAADACELEGLVTVHAVSLVPGFRGWREALVMANPILA